MLSIRTQIVAAAAVAALGTSAASAQTITTLVRDGDVFAGVGAVTLINNVAVNNNGDWLVEVDTDGPTTADAAVIKNGSVLLQEDQTLVGLSPGNLSSFDSVKINSAGVFNGNAFFRNTGSTTTDSGVLWNDRVVVQEGFISTAPQFSPGTPYIGWFETRVNDNNQILALSSVDDPAIASTVDRAIVLWQVDPTGTLLSENVIIKEGDALPGMGQLLTDTGTGPNTIDFNNAGTAMYVVDGDGATTSDSAVFINNAFVAREGDPSGAVPGRNWGSLASARVALNNSGDYAFLGLLDSTDTTNDTVIVKNGTQVIAREGFGLPAIGAFTFTSFGTSAPVDMDDNGNVLWFGDWNDPDTTRDTGLFLNDQLLVQEGVTMIDGLTLMSISGIEEGFRISDNGLFVIFEGQLAGGIDGAFMIAIPEPTSLGVLSAGALGLLARRRRRA